MWGDQHQMEQDMIADTDTLTIFHISFSRLLISCMFDESFARYDRILIGKYLTTSRETGHEEAVVLWMP